MILTGPQGKRACRYGLSNLRRVLHERLAGDDPQQKGFEQDDGRYTDLVDRIQIMDKGWSVLSGYLPGLA